MNDKSLPSEQELLELLSELQSMLSEVINNVEINSIPKIEARYLVWAAVSINQAAHGYIFLRKAKSLNASKILVRSMMESFINASAVMKKKGFLYRKYYTELLEEKKLPRPKTITKADIEKEMVEAVKKAKEFFKKFDTNYPFVYKQVKIFDAAEASDLSELYDVAYRVYCQFTHGAVKAATGELNLITDDVDTPLVVRFLIHILEILKSGTPAKIPDLEPYKKRCPSLLS